MEHSTETLREVFKAGIEEAKRNDLSQSTFFAMLHSLEARVKKLEAETNQEVTQTEIKTS